MTKRKKNKFVFWILLEDARPFEMMRQTAHKKMEQTCFYANNYKSKWNEI